MKLVLVFLLFLGFVPALGHLENKGRRFALTCYPSPFFETETGICELDMIAYGPTQVNITSLFLNDTINMVDGQFMRYAIDGSYRTTNGVEPLAFYIESDVEITLQLVNDFPTFTLNPDGMDASLGLPYSPDDLEFIIPSFSTERNECDPHVSPYGFYVVVAYEDDTNVSITERDGLGNTTVFTETLNKYDALTRTYLRGLPDFTGTRVIATRPVSVISGFLCSDFFMSEDLFGRGDFATHVPSISQIGTAYITPPIRGMGVHDEIYRIRVIATEDNTTIAFQGFEQFEDIGSGQFIEKDVFPNTDARLVTCSKKCLSYTIVPQWRERTGQFMFVLTSNDRFYTDVSFATVRNTEELGDQFDNQLGIIVQTNDEPQLLLDDEPLIISWNTTINNYSFGSVSISTGQHRLVSTNQEKFAAYVHGHCRYFPSSGYGNPAGMGVRTI